MNRIIILSFSISLLLYSWNLGKREIYLSCKNAEGISTKTELTVNGFQIGKVNDLLLTDKGEVLISAE